MIITVIVVFIPIAIIVVTVRMAQGTIMVANPIVARSKTMSDITYI